MATISEEEFSRLQMQLLELRSQNYELSSKLQKTESNYAGLNEKCSTQEKEIQKLSKVPKFSGFQGITKNKSKKDWSDMLEENERLNQQLQRQEEDFKLQNETLMHEMSRLSIEKEQITYSIEENEKLKHEIASLQKIIEDLKRENQSCQSTYSQKVPTINITELCNSIFEKLTSHLQNEGGTQVKQESLDTEPFSSVDFKSENKDNLNIVMGDLQNSKELYDSIEKICKNAFNDSTLTKNSNSESVEHFKAEVTNLQEQLLSLKETMKKETTRLTEEVKKWSEKAKRKQESFVKLQEEKERMYEENRISQEKLKENTDKQLLVYQENIKQLEEALSQAKDRSDEENLLSRINILRSENEALQAEIIGLQQLHKENLAEKTMQIEEKLLALHNEKEFDNEKLKILSEENQKLRNREVELEEKLLNLKMELTKANELAEKRKILLDASSKELHNEVEAHRLRLEETKNNFGSDIKLLVEKNNAEVNELKSQILNHKKLKSELEDVKSYAQSLEEQLKSSKEKSGWLQRALTDSEEALKSAIEKHSVEVEETKANFEKSTQDLISKYNLEKESLEISLESITKEKNDQTMLVEKLKESLKDKEVEHRIANKKNDQMIKELKRNLVSERKKADQAQSKLQDFIQEIKVKNTYDEIFNPESLQVKAMSMHRRQDSGSHLSLVSSTGGADNEDFTSPKSSSPMGSSTNIANLSDETVDLISRLADLQQEKWILEEKVRHLEESGAVMANDLMQKSLIIQTYVTENNGDVSPDRNRKMQTLKEKMLDKLKFNPTEDLMKEKTLKMQQMLEETLAKNAQLQKDLAKLTLLHSNQQGSKS